MGYEYVPFRPFPARGRECRENGRLALDHLGRRDLAWRLHQRLDKHDAGLSQLVRATVYLNSFGLGGLWCVLRKRQTAPLQSP